MFSNAFHSSGSKTSVTKMTTVSIVVRTKNNEQTLGECLSKIMNQKIDFSFEIIIIDSGSQDSTLDIANQFNVRILRIDSTDYDFADVLNLGVKSSRGEYIIFLSADAIPAHTRWAYYITKAFKDEKVAGVYGKQIPNMDANPITEATYRIVYHDEYKEKCKTSKSITDFFFSNANSAVRKETWSLHDFCYAPLAYYCEDQEWSLWTISKGLKIVYEPRAEVYHSHNFSLGQVLRRSYDTGLAMRGLKEKYNEFQLLGLMLWGSPVFSETIRKLAGSERLNNGTYEKLRWLAHSFTYSLFRTTGFFMGWLRFPTKVFGLDLSLYKSVVKAGRIAYPDA